MKKQKKIAQNMTHKWKKKTFEFEKVTDVLTRWVKADEFIYNEPNIKWQSKTNSNLQFFLVPEKIIIAQKTIIKIL